MKKKIQTSTKLLAIILLSGVVFQSCSLLLNNTVVENDIVTSTKRIKASFYYQFTTERTTPLVKLIQTIVKEVNPDQSAQYKVYDLLFLKRNSFPLEKKVYILTDNNYFKIDVKKIDREMVSNIDENRKDIMTADSSKVSVVTGYHENEYVTYRLSYSLNDSVVNRIKAANQVMLRYYAGPDMITIPVGRFNLKNLKDLLEKE